jgi:hypothetical protein
MIEGLTGESQELVAKLTSLHGKMRSYKAAAARREGELRGRDAEVGGGKRLPGLLLGCPASTRGAAAEEGVRRGAAWPAAGQAARHQAGAVEARRRRRQHHRLLGAVHAAAGAA